MELSSASESVLRLCKPDEKTGTIYPVLKKSHIMVNHSFIEAYFIPHNEGIFLYLKSRLQMAQDKDAIEQGHVGSFLGEEGGHWVVTTLSLQSIGLHLLLRGRLAVHHRVVWTLALIHAG